ncbi:MAG: hypothetical protein A2Y34_09090 [Spirochaetes bacterium GWC1_27_15]|nr:MAG: hypothetical protein A2Z98_07935 [Spirochaetes bacterium GWB1_27_13]OHD26330.1 MAG: hypothetical protein A2Y34_09090 [Spirochaetes bacterium GWC1_27_15]
MIARSWHGIVPIEKAKEFREYLLITGVADAKATVGNIDVYIYNKSQDGFEHFFMVSYWDSYDSIISFAGDQYYIAVTYEDDYKYNLISDPIVLHFEIDGTIPKSPFIE